MDAAAADSLPQVDQLPFQHAIAALPQPCNGAILLEVYHQLMDAIGVGDPNTSDSSGAYNLLMTRAWMMAVPRSQERFEKISINSLGFSGAMLVKKAEQLEQLKQIGPMTVLKAVGY